MYINGEHKEIVEGRGYGYIGSYKCKEVTIDNKHCKDKTYIRVKCPYCGAEYDVFLSSFKNGANCTHCCNKYENSFAYYIQQELGESLNKYWDWGKNELNPYYVSKNYNGKIWFKCTKTYYHGSYEAVCSSFVKGHRCPYCVNLKIHPKDSFAQYHIEHTDKDFIEKYWSDKNTIDPFSISPVNAKKVWIKCQERDYHEDYEIQCSHFTRGYRCPYCSKNSGKIHPRDSFGQWLINNYGEDALEKYWSDKNTVDPFSIAPQSNKKVWIKCINKDYHEDYLISCNNFYSGNRCPYCVNRKVHKLDSFGYLYPQYIKYWSKRNKLSPYEVAPMSEKKIWFYCEDCGSEFEARLVCLIGRNRSMKCLNCTDFSKGEQKINKYLKSYNIDFIPQKKFNDLIGTRGGNLSYDFYLPDFNLLIEYQGEQHDHLTRGFHKNIYDFKRQLEHDKRKKQYAIDHNIDLLEIWYWDYDKINEILNYHINKRTVA